MLALAGKRVATDVLEFHQSVGIETVVLPTECEAWAHAFAEVRDRALDAGGDGIDAAKRFGNETYDRARAASTRASERMSDHASRWRKH